MKRRNRSSLYSIMSSPVTLVIAFVLFVVFARAAWNIHDKARDSALRLEVAKSEFARLQDSQAELAARVDQLSTPAGVKAQIRERYHAVEPGEQVAVIVDNDHQATDTAAAADAPASSGGFWGWFLRLFGRD